MKINTKTIKNNKSMIVIIFTSASVITLININFNELSNSFATLFF